MQQALKSIKNFPKNALAWGFESERTDDNGNTHIQEGISIGLYEKPRYKKLAGKASAIFSLFVEDGKLVCEIDMKVLREQGGNLVFLNNDNG